MNAFLWYSAWIMDVDNTPPLFGLASFFGKPKVMHPPVLAITNPLPFGQSYWDYLPDMIQDRILELAAKDQHTTLMKQVCYQIKAHYHWKVIYDIEDTSDFGLYCDNCDEMISPEFSFRTHQTHCFNVRGFRTDVPDLLNYADEFEARNAFHFYLDNSDLSEDWALVYNQYAYGKEVDEAEFKANCLLFGINPDYESNSESDYEDESESDFDD